MWLIVIQITLLLSIGIASGEDETAKPDSYNEKCDTELCSSALMKKLTCNSSDSKCHGYLLPKGPCDCCPVCVGFEEKSAAKMFPTSTEIAVSAAEKIVPKIKELPGPGEVNERENEEYNLDYEYGTDEDEDEEESEETKLEIAKFLKVLLSEPSSVEYSTNLKKTANKYTET
ncbi:uncharacterized protein LOC111056811 [Nilaparvata lugens]|uniref:uncharacterized protein LOC111056811 n=1 Tax=Nilaparvata lugens TaxID=108931 RepID=UPI00193CACDD|nr:uncharacterized protein LOC111056811 [Nilaparvata lugens]XP_039275652.1 uncharacterized protein LOC111056811 [Nilaparvata lugens]